MRVSPMPVTVPVLLTIRFPFEFFPFLAKIPTDPFSGLLFIGRATNGWGTDSTESVDVLFYRIIFHDQMPQKFIPTLFIVIEKVRRRMSALHS